MAENSRLDPQRTVDRPLTAESPSTVDGTGAYQSAESTEPTASGPGGGWPGVPGYAITEEIAKGGMGRVFAARDLTLDREVAIKTLLPGADATRFVTESKITAKLPHPNIPPVYALGTLPDGSPFLAMKRIHGRTLSELLKARPTLHHDQSRFIQTFEQIAQAVGFAHSRGVIHRDLKPLNVMVGEFGEVQVMDWGLARSQAPLSPGGRGVRGEGDGDASPELTQAGAIMGTPGYMAPEQARGEVVDARADVFALGATLAAVLTGKPAFVGTTAGETIQKAANAELSEVLARLDGCGADAELVALVKRCLSAEPDTRPADGRAVATEVGAYRAGVETRLRQAETERAEAVVREGEQRKRRRVVQWAGGAIAAVLLAGLGVSLWQMNRAVVAEVQAKANERQMREERDAKDEALKAETTALAAEKVAKAAAERNLDFSRKNNTILGSVFTALDPKAKYETVGELRTALKKNIQKAVQDLEGSAIGEPLEVVRMQNTLAWSLLGLGEGTLAAEVLEKARETQEARLGRDHPDTLANLNNLALAYQAAGKPKKAVPLLEVAFARQKATLGLDDPDTLATMNTLAMGYRDSGKLEKAMQMYEEVFERSNAIFGPDHQRTLLSQNNLAECYRAAGKLEKALPMFETTLELQQTSLGANHPDSLTTMNNLGECYRTGGKPAQAVPLLEKTLQYSRTRLGADHTGTLTVMNNLAECYRAVGKPNQALPLYEEVVGRFKLKLGLKHPTTLSSIQNLGDCYRDLGKNNLALPMLEEVYKSFQSELGHDHPGTLISMNNLAMTYLSAGKVEKSLPLLEEALKRRKAKLGPDHPDTLTSMNNLGIGYRDSGNFDKAVPLLEETLRRCEAKLGPNHPDTIGTAVTLGRTCCMGKQGEKALLPLKTFVAARRKASPPEDPRFAGLLVQVSVDLLGCGQFTGAEEMLRESLAIRVMKQPDTFNTFNTQSLLGEALLGQKKYADAEPLLLKGYEGMKAQEKTIPPQGATRIPEALDRLIMLYTATNKPDEAKKYRELRGKYPRETLPKPRPAPEK